MSVSPRPAAVDPKGEEAEEKIREVFLHYSKCNSVLVMKKGNSHLPSSKSRNDHPNNILTYDTCNTSIVVMIKYFWVKMTVP